MKDSLYIVIPAYNEEENIEAVIDSWYQVISSHNDDGRSKLVVIDDGSKDNTLEVVKSMVVQDKYEHLEVITKANGGHGSSIYFGYQYAIESGADYVFQTDSDGQTLPEEFEEFWNMRTKADAIIGNRHHRGDGLSRKMVSGVLRLLIWSIFGVKVPDVNTPYRLINTDALKRAMEYVPKEYNLTNIALTAILSRLDEVEVVFLPITFRPRQAGKNSLNLIKIVRIGARALSDLRDINSKLR